MVLSFREFLNASKTTDAQVQDVLKQLSNLHSFFKKHPIISNALDTKQSVSNADLLRLQQDTLVHIVKIAPKPPQMVGERDIQSIAEMIALQSALSLLETVLAVKPNPQNSDFTEKYGLPEK